MPPSGCDGFPREPARRRGCASATGHDNVFILPGASPDSWAPRILGRIDPWATTNPRVRRIDANYYSCGSPCDLRVIRYPRTAGPLFGPNAPYADESIADGVDMTKTAINADGQIVVAGLSLGSITADAVQRSLDAGPAARSQIS